MSWPRREHPELQAQLVKAALPVGELEFDGQVRHVEFDEDVEYVPVPQSVVLHGLYVFALRDGGVAGDVI